MPLVDPGGALCSVVSALQTAVTPARRQVLGHGSTGNEHGRRKGVEESVHLIVTNTGNDSQEQSSFFRKEHRLDCYGIPMSTWVENFCHNLQRSMHEFFSAFLGEKTKETEPVHQGSLRGSSAVSFTVEEDKPVRDDFGSGAKFIQCFEKKKENSSSDPSWPGSSDEVMLRPRWPLLR